MSGFMNFLSLQATGQEVSNRENALTANVKEQIVDTCLANDTGKWETGIKRNGEWIIVEKYPNKEMAEKRHKYWVNKLRKNPKMSIKEVGFDEWL